MTIIDRNLKNFLPMLNVGGNRASQGAAQGAAQGTQQSAPSQNTQGGR
jgi:hypothetical protein